VKQVFGSRNAYFALTKDWKLYTWGDGTNGARGNWSNNPDQVIPYKINIPD
jgi:hypothetical protein